MSWLHHAIRGLHRMMTRAGFSKDWFLIPVAAVIGLCGGGVATGFSWLVHEAGHIFFGYYNIPMFPGSGYLLLIAIPAFGGLVVGIIQTYISRTGPTHGIPEVMESIARNGGKMPLRMGLFKTITASMTIGTGGSGGVEGPIIQTGSVLGSVVGQVLRVGREHMNTLVGCGAAAGMAGIFNAPIAAVMFVLEVMLRDFSFKTFIPVVVASVLGTATSQWLLGSSTVIFNVPEALHAYQFQMAELGPYALLGALCGITGVAFVLAEHYTEELWHMMRLPAFTKPAIGAVALGVLGIGFVLMFGSPVKSYTPPPFYSNGYPVTEALLDPISYGFGPEAAAAKATTAAEATRAVNPPGSSPAPGSSPTVETEATASASGADLPRGAEPAEVHLPRRDPTQTGAATEAAEVGGPAIHAGVWLLLVLVVFKLLGTALTMGSGGSGGFIAPSLFIGASLGGAVAMALDHLGLFPGGATPATYALAGMAGVIAATVHCPLTAFLLVFEITQDYNIVIPVMIVAILATTVAQFLYRDSVYTVWLRHRGVSVGSHADMTLLRRMTVDDVPLATAVIVRPDDPASRLIQLAEDFAAADYVVCDHEDHFVGMVVGEDVRTTLVQREAIPLMIVGELMRTNLPTVDPGQTLDAVLDKFSQHEVSSLAVVDANGSVQGVVSRSRLMRQYHQALAAHG